MSPKTKARVNLAINMLLAAGGAMLGSITADDTWHTVSRPIVVIGAAMAILGVLRAAFGPSPSTGE